MGIGPSLFEQKNKTKKEKKRKKYNDGSLQKYKHHIVRSISIIWSLKPKKLFSYSKEYDLVQNNWLPWAFSPHLKETQMINEIAMSGAKSKFDRIFVWDESV